MKYHVVDSSEWLYPDKTDYETSSTYFNRFCAKNGKACAHIFVHGAGEEVSIKVNGFEAEIYEEIDVPVESNIGFDQNNRNKFFPSRLAPFRVYDVLKPCDGKAKTKYGICAFYVCINAENLGGAGVFEGNIVLDSDGDKKEVFATVKVFDFTLPKESLKVVMGFVFGTASRFHDVSVGSAEYDRIRIEYLKMLRRMRQNMLYMGGVKVIKKDDGKYDFDFSVLEQRTKEALDLGFEYFAMEGVGFRRSWKASTIRICLTDMDAMSPEGKDFLSQYIPAFRDYLKEKGWLDRFYLGVADEPNDANALEFKELANIIRSYAPEIKLYDALSYNDKLHGALDVWIPLNKSYQENKAQFDSYRENGSEIWQYVCCGPRADNYMNRFMDYQLICSRYQFWGNYKYDLTGYLHWAAVFYQPDQDPWVQSCPHHVNADSETTLPAGDTHLIYPGEGQPYMSMRLELHREGLEDYEILKYIGSKNKEKADGLCNRCFKSFNKVEYDMNKFRQGLLELYKTAEQMGVN